ncbi:VasL domain-containing protein [Mixta intestinalis]|uniref:ImpA N-terminal domain-containing protein n=1 Tax=Mixta intestinalis TaxID=1615494 RepID=A0A6P1Q1C9_9GAMM|nr:VasL domain-containing protein [Mixta intestinalis]QHM71919.1 hypothetical protein C7M51_02212 [Mixta intestinalis]
MKNANDIKTGGDPRTLPDYAALRNELSKLSHPARPDVDWRHVETLSLALFGQNGVDLQTAAWYSLARTHIDGLSGLNEGLALTETLATRHWAVMWPTNTHGRIEILSGLSLQLQKAFRTLALNDADDLPLLYQIEKRLSDLGETLARHKVRQAAGSDILLQQIKQAIVRLENLVYAEQAPPAVVLPVEALTLAEPEPKPIVDNVIPLRPSAGNETAKPESRGGFRYFIAGVGVTLLAGAALLWGWKGLHQPVAEEELLAATMTPLPLFLSGRQLQQLQQSESIMQRSEEWAEQTYAQLERMMTLSPDWRQRYGEQLVLQAQTMWPDNPQTHEVVSRWQQSITANALPTEALSSWHDGMRQLQQLADRLNALDEKHGKYMTVSELKTAVYAAQKAFNRAQPAEERLRKYAAAQERGAVAGSEQRQAATALEQLQNRYFLISQQSTAIHVN